MSFLLILSPSRYDLSPFKINLRYSKKTSNGSENLSTRMRIERFFTKGMECLPSLSLINSDFYISDIIQGITVKHPTILICRESFKLNSRKLYVNFEFGCVDLEKKAGRKVFVDAMHISRYSSNHKIIITNWADPHSPRPDFWDENYPIKAIIFLSSGLEFHQPSYGDFFDFIEYSYLKEWSGGCLYPIVADIPFIDRDHGEWKYSLGLSLTFAGKDVQSAIFEDIDDPDSDDELNDWDVNHVHKPIEVQLEEFKNSLDFPTDDGRVLGFIFLDRLYEVEFGRFLTIELELVRKFFPKVLFMRFRAIDRIQFGLFNFHLIRI